MVAFRFVHLVYIYYFEGAKVDWDFRISDLMKTLMELIFNPCGDFGEVRRAQLAKSTFLTSLLVPLGSLKVCSDDKERMGCGKTTGATAPIHP